MSQDIIKSLLKEEHNLLQKLRENSDFRRFEAVGQMIAVYRATATPVPKAEEPKTRTETPPEHPANPLKEIAIGAGAGKSVSALIVENARDFLHKKRSRATSGEIGDEMIKRGLPITRERRSNLVSAALSAKSHIFDNVKDQGYGLTEWSRQQSH